MRELEVQEKVIWDEGTLHRFVELSIDDQKVVLNMDETFELIFELKKIHDNC